MTSQTRFSKLTNAELVAELTQLSSESAAIAASLESVPQAQRRTRNLFISAATTVAGAALSVISDFIGLCIALASLYVLFDDIVEDAEIHASEIHIRNRIKELSALCDEAMQELTQRGLFP